MSKANTQKNIIKAPNISSSTEFQCESLGLASTLVSMGNNEFTIDKVDKDKVYFIFPVDGFLIDCIVDYYEENIEVSPKNLFENMDRLKDLSAEPPEIIY